MKSRLILLLILLCPLAAFAQVSDEIDAYLREFPQRAAFNAHSYEFLPLKDTPAPRGFKPFYISHYGRHGSRSDMGDPIYAKLRDSLRVGAGEGILTPAGDSLLALAERMLELYDGMPERLTPRGSREHVELAKRMYHRYPSVFRKGEVHAISSTTPRCLVSMAAFTTALEGCNKKLVVSWDCGEKYQHFITRSFSKRWQDEASKIVRSVASFPFDTAAVYSKLFTDPARGRMIISNPKRIVSYIIAVASYAQVYDINDNYFSLLPWDAVIGIYCRRALNAYLLNCNSVEFGDRRIPRAADMAFEIVRKADEAIVGAPVIADLCFGHDWPFLGLCSFFGLEGYGYPRLSAEEAVRTWNGSRYCPFAANLQLVFYRNGKGKVLVKFLANEQETLIPELQAASGPYYDWNEVKSYLEGRGGGTLSHKANSRSAKGSL